MVTHLKSASEASYDVINMATINTNCSLIKALLCIGIVALNQLEFLALVCGVQLWVCHFPIGILGQVWYLIVSIPDLCTLTYFSDRIPCTFRCIYYLVHCQETAIYHVGRHSAMLETLSKKHSVTSTQCHWRLYTFVNFNSQTPTLFDSLSEGGVSFTLYQRVEGEWSIITVL